MDIFLQQPADRRRLLCEQTAAKRGLPPPVIEKDFWVCWTLRELFALPGWKGVLTFKGGTSLSKGWQLIARFSEDIDVVIERAFLGYGEATMSASRWKKLRDACKPHVQDRLCPALRQRMEECLPTALDWTLSPADVIDDPEQLTLLFHYPTVLAESAANVSQVVKIEFGGRTDTEPIDTPSIQSYIAEAFPTILLDGSFSVRTVAARRTFWEKAMLLHEERLRLAGKSRKSQLARHYYDLYCLIRHGVAKQATDDPGLFERVADHRRTVYGQKWVNYDTLCRGSLDMIPSTEQLTAWLADYEAMREVMFFEAPPAFDEILRLVQSFQDEFNGIPAGTAS